eukprot:scaffold114638_cov38-Prasinocladus_malaysianus.AAC.1
MALSVDLKVFVYESVKSSLSCGVHQLTAMMDMDTDMGSSKDLMQTVQMINPDIREESRNSLLLDFARLCCPNE